MKNNKIIIAIVIVLILVVAVVAIVALKPKKREEAPKAINKTMEILDENLGYKTTFTYPETESYVVKNVDNDSGRSVQVSFENVPLNLEAEVYYSKMRREQFDNKIEEVRDYKHFKQYTFGGYDAIVYSDYDNSAYIIVMIDEEKDESLFFSLDKMDYDKEGTIMDIVDSESFQNLFNSIKYENI